MYTIERQTCNKTSKRSSGSSSLRERKVESTEALSDSIRLPNLNNSLHQLPVLCWAQEYPRVYKLLGKQIQLKYEISDLWENNFSSTVALSDRVLYIERKRNFLNDLRGKVSLLQGYMKWRICLTMQEAQEMLVWLLGQEDPLEQEITTCSSILAWKIPWTEEPGPLQSIRSQRVKHDLVTECVPVCMHACTHAHMFLST